MGFIKKIINKFRPKPTIRKKVVVAPVQTTEATYSAEELAKIIPVEIEEKKEEILPTFTPFLGKSRVKISEIDNDLKIKSIVRPKPRYFNK